jgi:hypothetical protein
MIHSYHYLYEEQILKGNSIVLSEIEDQIENSSGELQYNLIRIREKFDKMRDVFEREIFPITEQITSDDIPAIERIKNINLIDKNLSRYNELSQLIITKYILKRD